jgi:hypothetical protein
MFVVLLILLCAPYLTAPAVLFAGQSPHSALVIMVGSTPVEGLPMPVLAQMGVMIVAQRFRHAG